MNKLCVGLALFTITAAAARAQEPATCWAYADSGYHPDLDAPPKSLCKSLLGAGVSMARAESNAFQADGMGVAVDAGPGCEAVVATAAATGLFWEVYTNDCGGGKVVFEAEVQADGLADLINADCAAAALGHAEVDSNITGKVRAMLLQSAGESSKGQLGGLSGSFGKGGFHVPVPQPGVGTGSYSDSDTDIKQAAACVDVLDYRVRTRGYIKVWANAALLKALCTADMKAYANYRFWLQDCPFDVRQPAPNPESDHASLEGVSSQVNSRSTNRTLLFVGTLVLATTIVGLALLLSSQRSEVVQRESEDLGRSSPTLPELTEAPGGGRAADAGTQGRSVVDTGTRSKSPVHVLVLAADTETGLAGARVEARHGLGEYEALDCDADGRVELPHPGVWTLLASAPGHVRRRLQGRLEPGELPVRLERAGSLEVEVRWETHKPVSGALVALLPPSADGEPLRTGWSSARADLVADADLTRRALRNEAEAPLLDPSVPGPSPVPRGEPDVEPRVVWSLPASSWRRTTDAEGRVRWDGLAPADGYRIEWMGPGFAEIDPPAPPRHTLSEDGAVAVRAGPPRTLSASVAVVAGESTRVAATRPLSGRVYGRLDTERGTLIAPCQVKLAHWTDVHVGPLVGGWDTDGLLVPSVTGGFEFGDVRPGKKKVTAHWSTSERVLDFAAIPFQLAGGEVRDLGTLSPLGGSDVVVEFALVDDQGASLPLEEVFGEPRPPRLLVRLATIGGGPGPRARIVHAFGVDLGSTWVLRGLPPGEVMLTPDFESESEVVVEEPFQVASPSYVRVPVPTAQVARLAFVATREYAHELRVRLPGPGPFPRLMAHWMKSDGGAYGTLDLRTSAREQDSSVHDFELTLALGRYRLLLHDGTLEEPPEGDGVFWTGEFELERDGGIHEIQLLPATSLSGSVTNAAGLPSRRVSLVEVGLGGWEHDGEPAGLYLARVDEHGRFRMRGLPAHTELRFLGGFGGLETQVLTSGSPGSHLTVDLRSER